ncbi:MAG: metallopeptidase family protein [Alphaproteobacteria bacterium]|nr:metallopeptidase family protein [Alphaproteobacteria bacterium]
MGARRGKEAWADETAPSLDVIEGLARDALEGLPDAFRALASGVVVAVQDFPTDEVLSEMGLESPFDILGLYHGIDQGTRESAGSGTLPDMVFLYRRPILDLWAEGEESLRHIVTHVLVHEIGHFFGLSDEEMHRIEDGAA